MGLLSGTSLIFDTVEHRVLEPCVDGGLAPARTSGGYPHLLWKRALLDLSIERRSGETGPLKHGGDSENAIGSGGSHGLILHTL